MINDLRLSAVACNAYVKTPSNSQIEARSQAPLIYDSDYVQTRKITMMILFPVVFAEKTEDKLNLKPSVPPTY